MQRLQRILSLADVEDARLRLAALELRNPLMGAPALAQALQVHCCYCIVGREHLTRVWHPRMDSNGVTGLFRLIASWTWLNENGTCLPDMPRPPSCACRSATTCAACCRSCPRWWAALPSLETPSACSTTWGWECGRWWRLLQQVRVCCVSCSLLANRAATMQHNGTACHGELVQVGAMAVTACSLSCRLCPL